MTPEGIIEKYLIERVRETGGFFRKLKWISRNGAPDRLIWWPDKGGVVHFVEVKKPGEKPTVPQDVEHNKMRDAGLKVVVIDTKERVDLFVRISK